MAKIAAIKAVCLQRGRSLHLRMTLWQHQLPRRVVGCSIRFRVTFCGHDSPYNLGGRVLDLPLALTLT